ncbi:GGDEF domain-containing protein [Pseudoalteromonas sp. B193]
MQKNVLKQSNVCITVILLLSIWLRGISLLVCPIDIIFEEILKVMIANNKRAKNCVALLALDLDNFKNINDTLGHSVGDEILIQTVERIHGCLRQNEGFARLGGDEFAVIIGGICNINQIGMIANRILAEVSKPSFA